LQKGFDYATEKALERGLPRGLRRRALHCNGGWNLTTAQSFRDKNINGADTEHDWFSCLAWVKSTIWKPKFVKVGDGDHFHQLIKHIAAPLTSSLLIDNNEGTEKQQKQKKRAPKETKSLRNKETKGEDQETQKWQNEEPKKRRN
jgi:hypothetical protein